MKRLLFLLSLLGTAASARPVEVDSAHIDEMIYRMRHLDERVAKLEADNRGLEFETQRLEAQLRTERQRCQEARR